MKAWISDFDTDGYYYRTYFQTLLKNIKLSVMKMDIRQNEDGRKQTNHHWDTLLNRLLLVIRDTIHKLIADENT